MCFSQLQLEEFDRIREKELAYEQLFTAKTDVGVQTVSTQLPPKSPPILEEGEIFDDDDDDYDLERLFRSELNHSDDQTTHSPDLQGPAAAQPFLTPEGPLAEDLDAYSDIFVHQDEDPIPAQVASPQVPQVLINHRPERMYFSRRSRCLKNIRRAQYFQGLWVFK